ncbi:sensor histidine kinase [Spongiactinospora rosea]|uniref:histidine kinase n=1 Tax=Spongiactinospora rosea TaxID=2248750 RepID=A0A366LYQ1_9ACTN|nr:sensor histidine kinase [Spongiactinospora rosea]
MSDSYRRWWPPRGVRADLLIAAGIAVASVVAGVAGAPGPAWPYGFGLALVAAAAVPARRRWPVGASVVVLAATLAYFALGNPMNPMVLAYMVMLYTLAEVRGIAVSAVFVVAVVAGLVWSESAEDSQGDIFRAVGWLLTAAAAGAVARQRNSTIAQAERRARAEERLRIARDLHDALGHRLSLINVQAAAALHRLGEHPERAESALAAIKEASREALGDLRATLGMLRQADERAPTGPPPAVAPATLEAAEVGGAERPGMAALDRLIAGARETGLAVRLRVECGRAAVPALAPEVDQAVYRIVQEALTNVTRHSGAGSAAVEIEFDDGSGQVTVRVDDDGSAVPGPPGHGIRGMRERAAALGGELATGPLAGGGFGVSARLPVRGAG